MLSELSCVSFDPRAYPKIKNLLYIFENGGEHDEPTSYRSSLPSRFLFINLSDAMSYTVQVFPLISHI